MKDTRLCMISIGIVAFAVAALALAPLLELNDHPDFQYFNKYYNTTGATFTIVETCPDSSYLYDVVWTDTYFDTPRIHDFTFISNDETLPLGLEMEIYMDSPGTIFEISYICVSSIS